jgi:DNA ligase D-like protein (predicted ligase)
MLRVSDRAKPAVFPSFIPPLRPGLVTEPPEGDGWLHEIKHDGYRTQVIIAGGQAKALTMNGHDWSDRYVALVRVAAGLPCHSAVIDGEAVVQDSDGRADFQALQRTMLRRRQVKRGSSDDPIALIAFDLLHLDGKDLRSWSLEQRREALADLLVVADPAIQFSEAFTGAGAKFLRACEKMGLEGVVSKRLGSSYRSGTSTDWRKTKCLTEGDFVVIGAAPNPKGPPFALLAREVDGELVYAGSAFVTLDGRSGDAFWRSVEALAIPTAPIAGLKRQKVTWCKPTMRVRARHLRGEEPLRHAALIELRS